MRLISNDTAHKKICGVYHLNWQTVSLVFLITALLGFSTDLRSNPPKQAGTQINMHSSAIQTLYVFSFLIHILPLFKASAGEVADVG